MDNAAQPNPPVPNPSTPSNSPIPSIDPKAPLKIEEKHEDDAPKVNYGEKLFIAGVVFFCLIIVCAVAISFFWTQNANQTQKTVTLQQSK